MQGACLRVLVGLFAFVLFLFSSHSLFPTPQSLALATARQNALYLLDLMSVQDFPAPRNFKAGTVRPQAATRWCYIPESEQLLSL